MQHIPYIGITDFTHPDQVRRMLQTFEANVGPERRLRLHVGVMMSHKTLRGLPTRWSAAFPPKEAIADIFSRRGVMNCLHYADYEGTDFEKCLREVIRFGGDGMTALQLDMIWPDHEVLASVLSGVMARSGRKFEAILQVGQNALEQAGDDPANVVARLRPYRGFITHVLLSKSMGRGFGMSAKALRPHIIEIRSRLPELGIAVAGGLGPRTLHLVEPLIAEFPDLSIDAQSKLRPSGNALHPIDWDWAAEYLGKAIRMR